MKKTIQLCSSKEDSEQCKPHYIATRILIVMKYQTKKKEERERKKSIPSLNSDFSKKKQGKNYRR